MTQEDKELLVKDLCARLPYGVKAKVLVEDILRYDYTTSKEGGVINGIENLNDGLFVIKCKEDGYVLSYDEFKPYLRPMSSMTDKQKVEYNSLRDLIPTEQQCEVGNILGDFEFVDNWRSIDYLNTNHFDFRGLIERGLAIDATNLNIY